MSYRISDFLMTGGIMYINQYTTLLQVTESVIIPENVVATSHQLPNQYVTVETVKRSPMKQRVSLKGKVVKVGVNPCEIL